MISSFDIVSTIYDEDKYPPPYTPDDGREDITAINVGRMGLGGAWWTWAHNTYDVGWFTDSRESDNNSGVRCVRDFDPND